MTFGSIHKGHCPKCGADRSADVVGRHRVVWEDEVHPIDGATEYRILSCRGCESVYFQTTSTCSEEYRQQYDHRAQHDVIIPIERIEHWPSPAKRQRVGWLESLTKVDRDLGDLFDDVYTALDADLRVLAAIAVRTVFDRASELLGVDPAASFTEKLKALYMSGKISSDDKTSLSILTDAGSAAAHRGWKPNLSQLDTMMSILESFIHRALVLPSKTAGLEQAVPPRPKRKKTLN